VTQTSEREGLRERKKRLTRETLVNNALRLFRERGFEHVTTSEIADASNVAVKTLFVYFPCKEDLVFADEDVMIERVCTRIRERPPGTSATEALRALAHELVAAKHQDPVEGLGEFASLLRDSPSLQCRLLLMWERYEQAVAVELARERGGTPQDPDVRIGAALLISPFRVLTSTDVRERADIAGDSLGWLDRSFDVVARGLG
jgi:AcrR family transcriptional regulator